MSNGIRGNHAKVDKGALLKRIPRPGSDSDGEVGILPLSKCSHLSEGGLDLPNKRKGFLLVERRTLFQWWTLVSSLAKDNESLMLEMSWAWKLIDKTRAHLYNSGTRSLGCVFSRNKVG